MLVDVVHEFDELPPVAILSIRTCGLQGGIQQRGRDGRGLGLVERSCQPLPNPAEVSLDHQHRQPEPLIGHHAVGEASVGLLKTLARRDQPPSSLTSNEVWDDIRTSLEDEALEPPPEARIAPGEDPCHDPGLRPRGARLRHDADLGLVGKALGHSVLHELLFGVLGTVHDRAEHGDETQGALLDALECGRHLANPRVQGLLGVQPELFVGVVLLEQFDLYLNLQQLRHDLSAPLSVVARLLSRGRGRRRSRTCTLDSGRRARRRGRRCEGSGGT
mmetsp:Transcript_92697/g.265730  ORF Transcript_92697/g.265730 Transcript_92697/m.265730 type:complete len:275 (-) Transcript_92697:1494-2318(-)